jgi:hypothetical protein
MIEKIWVLLAILTSLAWFIIGSKFLGMLTFILTIILIKRYQDGKL